MTAVTGLDDVQPVRAAPYGGPGYIAGEAPGITTVDGSPASVAVRLMHRRTASFVGYTISNAAGEYRFDGLSLDAEAWCVIASAPASAYNGAIRDNVTAVEQV